MVTRWQEEQDNRCWWVEGTYLRIDFFAVLDAVLIEKGVTLFACWNVEVGVIIMAFPEAHKILSSLNLLVWLSRGEVSVVDVHVV